jgi:hypothetical protein
VITGLLFLYSLINAAYGQIYADTAHHNRNVLLEEFTAVHCYFCPAGHALADSLIEENPDRICAVAMHPSNTSYTAPYAGSPDFRRSFPNALFSVPFATDSLKFFPGAFINRVLWQPGRREQYTFNWRRYCDSILSKPSPVNIGIFSTYDPATSDLSVTVELYFTSSFSPALTLMVYLTEDSLTAEQNNGGTNYIHNHIFRESLSSQWGDTVVCSGLQGSVYSRSFQFSNASAAYNIQNLNVIAALRIAGDESILTATGNHDIQLLTSIPVTVRNMPDFKVYPNPFNDLIYLETSDNSDSDFNYSISDSEQKLLMSGRLSDLECSGDIYTLPVNSAIPKGLVILTLWKGERSGSYKLLHFPER